MSSHLFLILFTLEYSISKHLLTLDKFGSGRPIQHKYTLKAVYIPNTVNYIVDLRKDHDLMHVQSRAFWQNNRE